MRGPAATSGRALRRPMFRIAGQRYEIESPAFAAVIASAHAAHHRPQCLCRVDGVEMYVARLGAGFIVKRMPDTGSRHAPDCPSYEPPAKFSGLGPFLGPAICENPATGLTTLRLGFSMSKIVRKSTVPLGDSAVDSVASDGTKLSLRGLLHYLWDQAELTRWHVGFAGKRSWAAVRWRLLRAAEHKIARGAALGSRLYIPEAFWVERRDAINSRRAATWVRAVAAPGHAEQLMLVIAEVKEIVPARYGFKVIVKHVPDRAFEIDEPLYRRLERRFERELSLWGSADNLRMVMIATFCVSEPGVPTIAELSLMPVTAQWLPIENPFERPTARAPVRGQQSSDAQSFGPDQPFTRPDRRTTPPP